MRMKTAVAGAAVSIVGYLLLSRVQAAEETTVYTPFGSTVEALIKEELSPAQIQEYNQYVQDTYPNAVWLDDASTTYNCHAYAWHVSEGGGNVWIGVSGSEEDVYWEDGSYLPVPSEADAHKVSYASDDHSAVATGFAPGWFVSKWGSLPLMFHKWDYCPYNHSELAYYRHNPGTPRFVAHGGGCWDPAYAAQHVYGSLQGAIDAAADGDTVIVCPGTYEETVDFGGKAITVRSAAPGDPDAIEATVIDGGGGGTAVVFHGGEGADSVLSGFTVRNGSSPAPGDPSGAGGGIRCSNGSSPALSHLVIAGNAADLGGGLYCGGASSPSLLDVLVTGNEAEQGGGIYCTGGSSPALVNAVVSGNSADGSGGGIFCGNACSPVLTNNTVYGNSAGTGGGAYCAGASSPVMVNTILWANQAAGGAAQIQADPGSSPSVTYCDVQGGWGAPADHNLNAAPLLVDPGDGDFRLQANSPCIDAGTNGAPSLPETDFEGDARIFNGDHLGFTTVDIGADEFWSDALSPCAAGAPGAVRYVTQDPAWPGFAPPCVYDRIQDALDDASDGDTILVGPGTYLETIGIYTKEVAVRSDADGDPATYDPAPAATVIDGGKNGSVVYFEETEEMEVVLAGFTIRNGMASDGGGIVCYLSSPALDRTIICGNTAFGSGPGGGIELISESCPVLTNNIICGNSAAGGGGGIHCGEDCSPLLVHNTISGNSAASGGGILCEGEASPVLINSILWGNTASVAGPQIHGGDPTVAYCDVQGGWAGAGNINADPLFLGGDPFDYHLGGSSPCMDMGTWAGDLSAADIDGDERPVDFPGIGIDGEGKGYDMGADELVCPWGLLIDLIFGGKGIALLPPVKAAGCTPLPVKIASGPTGVKGALGLLYGVRARMTPRMRATAEAANPALLHLMQRDPQFTARMVKALGAALPLIERPDTAIPKEAREEMTRISCEIEQRMKRERIKSPAMASLLPEIRKMAQDTTAATVRRMIEKYGAPSASR